MRRDIRLWTSEPIHTPVPVRAGLEHAHALPHDAGASLPLVQRYTDHRFRAVAKKRLRYARDEFKVEVAALLRAWPIALAAHAFHWSSAAKKYARTELMDKFATSETVELYHKRNMEALGVGQVLALLQAARDGGWVKRKNEPLPELVRLAMRAARDEGKNVAQIAELFGFGYWTVSYAMRVPHGQRMARKRVGLVL